MDSELYNLYNGSRWHWGANPAHTSSLKTAAKTIVLVLRIDNGALCFRVFPRILTAVTIINLGDPLQVQILESS